jgi:hypothetical protein
MGVGTPRRLTRSRRPVGCWDFRRDSRHRADGRTRFGPHTAFVGPKTLPEEVPLLHYIERPYWETWCLGADIPMPRKRRNVRLSESVMMLEAPEARQGIATREGRSLEAGRLIRLSEVHVSDGIGYFFCATPSGLRKESVRRFREWVFSLNRSD